MLRRMGAVLLSAIFGIPIAHAGGAVSVELLQKLRPVVASGVGGGQWALGNSLAVAGYKDDGGNGVNAGAAYVFESGQGA